MPAIAPTKAIRMIKFINDRINPAIASPLGLLNRPIRENNMPRNHIIQPTTGNQEKNNDINDKIKPAVPILLD